MNLRQLRYFEGIVEEGFNISRAAHLLHTSQPGISKQIQLLERELGVDLLLRRGNRIIGVTEPGRAVLGVARRMLQDARNLKHIGDDYAQQDAGRLIVGTTHTHARYVLPDVILRFTDRYPRVQLVMRQDNEGRVADMVAADQADIGVSAQPPRAHDDLLMFPCYELKRCVMARPGHPLLAEKRLTLEKIARYPVITLDDSFAGGRSVTQAFEQRDLAYTVAMTATDADVIKFYAELGLGIAILPTIAHDAERDRNLVVLDASHLFDPTVAYIHVRRHGHLRGYMFDFIRFLAPQWDRAAIEAAAAGQPLAKRRLPVKK